LRRRFPVTVLRGFVTAPPSDLNGALFYLRTLLNGIEFAR
jgi:hypothetical protein